VLQRLSAAHILVTTGTLTSARIMAERLPPRAFHQFVPLDAAPWVKGFLDHWRPDLAFWVESELWPNLLLESSARGVPIALINARLSERSFRGWKRWPASARRLVQAFRLVLAQRRADRADQCAAIRALVPRLEALAGFGAQARAGIPPRARADFGRRRALSRARRR